MLACIASESNPINETILIEKNDILGKKMLITGKGRCNITNGIDISEFIKNIPQNGKFLFSAFQNFTNKDIIDLIEIKTKEERGHRIFPVSDQSKDVVDSLIKKLKKTKIIIKCKAEEILAKTENGEKIVSGVKIKYLNTNKEEIINCDKVILATGGKSYPLTRFNWRWL